MANYTTSKNESDQIATLLAAGSKLDTEDKQATLPNLIRGSLNSMMTLMEKQKEQITLSLTHSALCLITAHTTLSFSPSPLRF